MSRNHAAIVLKEGRCVIRDNKSSNGTFLNGIRIPPLETRVIFPGDDIRVGNLLLRYLEGEVRLTESAIAGYTILDLFAEDESTVSFHAREAESGREVMLVLLRPSLLPDARARAAFRDEAEAGAMLDHPHIVPVHDFVNDSARLYYTRAWVPFPPLTFAMCAESAPRVVANVGLQLAAALDHAHEKGVFHGCLHPSWLHLSDTGQVLVRGFGTSVRAESLRERLSCFLTPEQIEHRPLDGRTDLYALGAILYQLLTGKPVYSGLTPEEIQSKILHDSPDPLTRHRPDCPEALNEIILTLLQRDPSNRYQTAGELREALDLHLNGAPASPSATPDPDGEEANRAASGTTSAPTKHPPNKTTRKMSAPGRMGQTTRSTHTSTSLGGGTASSRATSTIPKEKGSDTLLITGIVAVVLLVAGVVGVGVLMRGKPGDTADLHDMTEDPGRMAVHRDTLEREAREAMEAGDSQAARRLYVQLVETFPQDALIQTRARGIIARIDRAQERETRQARFRQEMDAYRARLAENPGATTELQGILDGLHRRFPEFAAEIDAASRQLLAAQGDVIQVLRNDIRILLRDGEIDRANNRIDQFTAGNPDHPQIGEADVLRASVQETFDRLSTQYRERIQAQLQANMFGRALEIMEEMREHFRHAETLERIAVDEGRIHAHLQSRYHAMEDQLRILLGQRAYSEASALLQEHRPAFYGTRHESGVADLTRAVSGAQRLQVAVIEAISKNPGRPVPDNFNMPQMHPLREGGGR